MKIKGLQKYNRALNVSIPQEGEKLAYSAARSLLGSCVLYTRPVQRGMSIAKSLREYRQHITYTVAGRKVRKGAVYPRRGGSGYVAIQRVGGGSLPFVTPRNASGRQHARPASSYLGKTRLGRERGNFKRRANNTKDVYVTDAGSLRAMTKDLGKRVGGRLAGWQAAARGLKVKNMRPYQMGLRGGGGFSQSKHNGRWRFILTNRQKNAMKKNEIAQVERHAQPVINAASAGAVRNVEKILKKL